MKPALLTCSKSKVYNINMKKRGDEDDSLRFRITMSILNRPFAHPVEITNINNSLRVKEGRIQFQRQFAKNLVSVVYGTREGG